jgi:hypothetical protein
MAYNAKHLHEKARFVKGSTHIWLERARGRIDRALWSVGRHKAIMKLVSVFIKISSIVLLTGLSIALLAVGFFYAYDAAKGSTTLISQSGHHILTTPSSELNGKCTLSTIPATGSRTGWLLRT